MSLPRILTPDFFTQLTDSIQKAGGAVPKEQHESPSSVKVLCIQQSPVGENRHLIEVLDGSVPVKYKHTCLAIIPTTADGDSQLVGRIISFTKYNVIPTRSRYLILLTNIAILPGDYRHLTSYLGTNLVYHPSLTVKQQNAEPVSKPVEQAGGFQTSSHATKQPMGQSGNTTLSSMPSSNTINTSTSYAQSHHATTSFSHDNSTNHGPIRNTDDQLMLKKPQSAPYATNTSKPVVKVGDGNNSGYISIADLTIYTPKWSIRARVLNKTHIKKFNNQWGEGQLFSVDLCDNSGDIRATLFGEAVTKWYNFIEEGQVYSISGGQLRPANKKFNSLSHACEMSLDENSQILLDRDDQSIPLIRCNFVPIKQVERLSSGDIIDVIGIVARFNDIKSYQSKSTGTTSDKREILLCDSSGSSVWVTLWNKKVQQFLTSELETHPIIAMKGVRVNEWQGKKLDTIGTTHITINPAVPEVAKLKNWWATEGSQMQFDAGRSSIDNNIEDIISIGALTQAANQAYQFKALGDSGITFTARGMVEVIRENTFSWPACVECQRKMVNELGQWVCSRCKCTRQPRHTYILSMKISDDTGHLWATASSIVGDEIMNGIPAAEVLALAGNNDINVDGKNFMNIFEEARLTEYIFKIKVYTETYMDEPRIKYRVTKAIKLRRCLDTVIKCLIKEIDGMML